MPTIETKGATVFMLLDSVDAANTAAATTVVPVDISEYEGTLMIVQNVGVVTAGTIVGKLVHGDESDLSDAADIAGAAFTSNGTSTDGTVQKIVIECNAIKKYLGYVGTIDTGPAQVSVIGIGQKKYI